MPVPVYDPNVVAEGLALLTSHFSSQPNITGILGALLRQVQKLEDSVNDYLFKVQLANHPIAGGPWDILDKIGKIVGEPRAGRSDADYVPAIKIRIRTNRSNGLAEDIIQIALLLATTPVYQPWPFESFTLTTFGVTTSVANALIEFLGEARSAESEGQLRYTCWTTSNPLFVLGDSTGSIARGQLNDSVAHGFSTDLAAFGEL